MIKKFIDRLLGKSAPAAEPQPALSYPPLEVAR